MEWKGSVFERKGALLMAIKKHGKWKQIRTPYRVGQEKQAGELLRRTRELLLAGTDAGLGVGATVADYALGTWLDGRKAHVSSWDDDLSRLNTHILPAIGALPLADVRARHIAGMIAQVREGTPAPRTVRNIYSVTRALFRDAMIAGLCEQQPCILTHHQLGKVRDAHHEWRSEAIFTAAELFALMTDARVPEDRRVLYGLLGLGCLRHGEAAALRWRHIVPVKPLSRLAISNSNESATTKSGVERGMPIHRFLGKLLAEWKLSGWPREFGRLPMANDLVVPHTRPTNRGPRVEFGGMRSDHDSYKRLRIDCGTLAYRHRRTHDLRRTGITLYRAADADEKRLRRGTHGVSMDVMELYTEVEWSALCAEIGKLCALFVRPLRFSSRK